MHVLKTNFNGNPNIGLFCYANDSFALVGKHVSKKIIDKMMETLKVPVHMITLCGTDLVGVFAAGNENCLLVPNICFESEIRELKRLNIRFEKIPTHLTALGNNILCNSCSAIVNQEFSARVKKLIRTKLNVRVVPGTIAHLDTVGSLCIIRKEYAVISPSATENELKKIEKLFNVRCINATVNFGSYFLGSGMVANSNGFVIGDTSTGVEITNIDEGLGFLG